MIHVENICYIIVTHWKFCIWASTNIFDVIFYHLLCVSNNTKAQIKQYCALWCIWFVIHFARPICILRHAIYPPVVISYYFLCRAWQRNFEFSDKSYRCIYCDQHKSRPATPSIECKLNVYSPLRYDGLILITIGRFPR